MRFIDGEGKAYEAETYEGLLVELTEKWKPWAEIRGYDLTVQDYMEATNERIYNLDGLNIDTKTPALFIKGLIKHGLIKEIN